MHPWGITPAPGTVSASANFMAYDGNPGIYTITAYSNLGNTSSLVIDPGLNLGCYGFVTTGASEYIASIVESQTSNLNYTSTDNFAFSVVPLPEPSTLVLGVLGMAGLAPPPCGRSFAGPGREA